jgi:hypothetical protein
MEKTKGKKSRNKPKIKKRRRRRRRRRRNLYRSAGHHLNRPGWRICMHAY